MLWQQFGAWQAKSRRKPCKRWRAHAALPAPARSTGRWQAHTYSHSTMKSQHEPAHQEVEAQRLPAEVCAVGGQQEEQDLRGNKPAAPHRSAPTLCWAWWQGWRRPPRQSRRRLQQGGRAAAPARPGHDWPQRAAPVPASPAEAAGLTGTTVKNLRVAVPCTPSSICSQNVRLHRRAAGEERGQGSAGPLAAR